MKKSYKIEVDCANCANIIEDLASKIDGVKSVAVNFILQKMTVEFIDGAEPKLVIKDVLKAGKKVEPDFEILG
jgi:copper chaperone CopZ